AVDSAPTASAMYSFSELNSISAAFAAYGTKQTLFGTKLRLYHPVAATIRTHSGSAYPYFF
ncbi:hypothetical protein A2U01_0019590, partial [Trifolium medium]|nr:hypothetical protein [Trifolium medium]